MTRKNGGCDRAMGRHVVAMVGVLAGALGLAGCQGTPAEPPADLLILNGRVFVADEAGSTADAVAVRGNTIVRVGTTAEVSALRGPTTRVIDAAGGAVVPGFNDAHVHFLSGGFSLDQVDLAGLVTLPEVQRAIRDFASARPDHPWVEGFGWLYAPFPGGSPTAAQLDAAIPDRPAVMDCYDGHSIWVNSRALAAAGITRDTPDPPNGAIVRDPRTGTPTGHLKESAAALVRRVMPKLTAADRRSALKAAMAHANRFGITSIQNAGTSVDEIGLYEEARKAGDLTVRAYLAFRADASTTEADADAMVATWQRLRDDDPTLGTGIVKMFADGVIESRTAAMLDPFPGSDQRGVPNLTEDELTRVVTMLDRRGLQVQIHAIGDRAIRMALDAFEHAARVNPAPSRGRRHRLEHIEAVAEADIPRLARLGVIASVQPMHVALGDMNQVMPSGPWPDNVGPERQARAWAWRRITAAGARLAFGSDWPVATLEAGQGIWLAATRVGETAGMPQAMPMADVIRAYTSGAAYASFDEARKGMLRPGMLADIAVLTTDILTAAPSRPTGVVVAATIFDGRVVHERGR